MGSPMNVRAAFTDPVALMHLRLSSQNARHVIARAGVEAIRANGLDAAFVNQQCAKSPRGFYSWVLGYGLDAITPALKKMQSGDDVSRAIADEFITTGYIDSLFSGFNAASQHGVLDLSITAYPSLSSLDLIDKKASFATLKARFELVRELLEKNFTTPLGEASPIFMPEDHPGWATEKPDIRNIRGNMRAAVAEAVSSAQIISNLVEAQYGSGTMDRIKNIVVLGIGANDEYLKALPEHLNKDITRQRNLYSVFEPSQLDSLPADVTAENTLFIAISRGGNTEETIKSLYFAKKQGLMKYLVGYANKGLVKEFVEQENGILQSLNPNIGGRYMWAKGLIVLVPFFLAASKAAWHEYTDAMIDFDDKFWPVGNDRTVLAMSKHLFYYREIYNIFTIIACSNNPTLEKGLREFFQNFNEASGKIKNASIAVGPGMDMLPFAHSGADGMLGAAISALLYGVFVFDTSYTFDPARDLALAKEDLLPKQEAHAGLSKALLKMACVFPNQAKFTYAGGPNMMVGMNGINYRNLATLTALYQNLMYVFLISNETNPDSNPNVQMVRDTTGGVVKALLQRHPKESPIEVINRAIPNIMKG